MGAKIHGQRIAIWVIVIAFVLSSIGFSGLVIWQITREDDSANSNQDIQKQLEEQLAQQNKEGKLEGTKLENFEPVSNVSELKKIDIKEGNGEVVKAGATVTAHYTGAVAVNGIIFQSSKDMGQPVPFPLDGVIKGWTEGVPGMKVGGVRRLVIPADLAYSANPPQGSNIPPNAALVFDIEVVSVQQ